MRMRSLLVFLAIGLPAFYFASDPGPVVFLASGEIRGKALVSGGAVFQGIPYAAPPVGALRWRAPAPVQPWIGVRDATSYGPPCAQNPYFLGDAKQTSREDCLYLNVWMPAWPAQPKNLPVMVWIPGGGNFAGNSASEAPGNRLIAHGVVLVTLNYRVGLFGFFSLPELTRESPLHASGNQGILDQIAALHWVQRNIAKFGGDPANVTLFGESAGSLNVSALMTSPLSQGLFRRVIGESGAVQLLGEPLSLPDAEKRGMALAANWTPGGGQSLQTLRAVPASEILAKEPNFLHAPPPNLGLTVDGYVFPQAPADVFAAGKELPVDLLHGSLAHEWIPGVQPPADSAADLASAIAAAYPPKLAAEAAALYRQAGTDPLYGTPAEQWVEDSGFRCSSVQQLEWHARAGNVAYEFQFDRLPPAYGKRNNSHHSEVQYVFGFDLGRIALGRFDATDAALSQAMAEYWTNFAKSGNPNSANLPNWPRFEPKSKNYLEFTDAGPVARQDLRGSFCRLWIEAQPPRLASATSD